MSRRREFEIMFGSDSFLDVVANIVGILIILIVIAGVRVSQAPPITKSPSAPDLGTPADITPVTAPPVPQETTASAPEPIIAEVTPETDPQAPPEPLPPLIPPPDLVSQAGELEAEIAAMTVESSKLAETIANFNLLQTNLNQKLETAQSLLGQRQTEITASTARQAQQKQDLELTRQAVARLQAEVDKAEKKSANVSKLEHRITPVSRTVVGRELHFRLEKGRVAEVPIDALVERLKEHIERRKDWIVKMRQHKGQIGPINGFNLEYVINVEMVSGLDELRAGIGGYRMSMRYWEILPEPSLRGEPEDVALSQGSKFYQGLLGASPDTTLTFWVYPDSYHLYRKLQAFAHQHGFPVAGRPLPEGVAISGSPNGTKSASQ